MIFSMIFFKLYRVSLIFSIILLCFIAPFSFVRSSNTFAEDHRTFIRQVRSIENDESGILNPSGLAFSPNTNSFYVLSQNQPNTQAADIFLMTLTKDRKGSARIATQIKDPINMTFDFKAKRLVFFNSAAKQLIEVKVGPDGNPDPSTLTHHQARYFGLQNPQGMAVDPQNGHLFILDATGPRLVRVEPDSDEGFANALITQIDLQLTGLIDPRGLALDPTTGHLHVLSQGEQRLYELTEAGQLVTTRDVSGFELNVTQGMVFANSGDLTDDPEQTSLYIADSGLGAQGGLAPTIAQEGQIVELSLTEIAAPAARIFQSSLVQVIDTSQFIPPSPDSAGIAYLSSSDTLLMCDSEVDEMSIYSGANIFEMTLSGILTRTSNTLSYTDEPTGVAYNPANEHIFISDDDQREIYEVDPGDDGLYNTLDDSINSFDTMAFNSTDPEDVAYDPLQGVLYIVDGVNNEVYRVSPGSNGIFDGLPPAGDDQVSSFDTAILGITDPEGIAFDTDNNMLYIVGEPENLLAHLTTTGSMVRLIDTSEAGADKPAGLAYAPSSLNPSEMNIYIAARGVDNDNHPNENDGKVYEMSFPPISPGNTPPTVDAGPDQSVTYPDNAILEGMVTDDLLPNPPGVTSTIWSQASGPGTVNFTDAGAVDTTASFSLAGTYVLRLSADDGELSASDDMTVVATGDAGLEVIEVRVAANSDDAEEKASGSISLTSSDLELVFDGSDQTVGMRFNGVDIPQNAYVSNAFIQFQVDEASLEPTFLIIEGEDVDNAETFSSSSNISPRPRTGAYLSWSPNPWRSVGEAGVDQRTPNIAPVIQEIVNRSGWSSGNSLAIIITGTGERVAEAFDGDPNAAPLLHVEFTSESPPNIMPVAVDDAFTIDEDTPLTGDVLANDTLGDAPNLVSLAAGGDVSNGTLTLNTDGSFEYTPGFNYNGPDSFTYTITDVDNETATAVVTITVNSVNDLPVAVDDALSTPEDTPLTGDVLANDTLGDAPNLVSLVSGVSHGGLILNADGSFTYTPGFNYNGPDSFTYTITDADNETATAVVTITVAAVGDTPVAVDDAFTIDEDTPLTGDVLANDTLGDAPNLVSLAAGGDVSNGTLTLNTDGSFEYTPGFNYNGPDSFTYTITDVDNETATAVVTITVNSVNDLPVAVDDALSTPEDTPLTGDVLANDTLGDAPNLVSLVSGVSHGGLILNADGSFTYTPGFNYNGPDSFTYTITDADNETATAVVTITVAAVGDTPVAVDDAFTIDEDTPLTGDVLANDTLGDAPNLVSLAAGGDVSNGTLTLNTDGSFEYTPGFNYNGPDSFTYTITDVDNETATAVVTITVNSVNDLPVAVDDALSTPEDTPLTGDVLANDTLGDAPNLVSLVSGVSHGGLILNADGSFTYTPGFNYNGPDSFTYTITDADNETATAVVTITVAAVGDTPVAVDDAFTIDEDTPLTGDVLANDTLGDAPNLVSLAAGGDVSNGTLTLNTDGSFEYTPGFNYNGPDSFTYTITDVDNETATAVVTITVNSVNDLPVAVDDALSTPEDTPLTGDVLANDTLGDAPNR